MEKNNVLTIDIVSDVVCPWRAIGYERLKKQSTSLVIKLISMYVGIHLN